MWSWWVVFPPFSRWSAHTTQGLCLLDSIVSTPLELCVWWGSSGTNRIFVHSCIDSPYAPSNQLLLWFLGLHSWCFFHCLELTLTSPSVRTVVAYWLEGSKGSQNLRSCQSCLLSVSDSADRNPNSSTSFPLSSLSHRPETMLCPFFPCLLPTSRPSLAVKVPSTSSKCKTPSEHCLFFSQWAFRQACYKI